MPHDYREDWKTYGDTDPYFGVLTDSRYHRDQLTAEALAEFWATGEAHVERVAGLFRTRLGRELRPGRALEFGCGVGRVLVPLARRSGHVVGVDAAPGMLAEARKACRAAGLGNVELVEFSGSLAGLAGPFDLVHSYIVLQHIPTRVGTHLVEEMLALLAPGGLAMLHLTYALPAEGSLRAAVRQVRAAVPLVNGVANLLRRRRWREPRMQMNAYDLNQVLRLFQRAGCHRLVSAFSDHGGALGVALLAEKTPEGSM